MYIKSMDDIIFVLHILEIIFVGERIPRVFATQRKREREREKKSYFQSLLKLSLVQKLSRILARNRLIL